MEGFKVGLVLTCENVQGKDKLKQCEVIKIIAFVPQYNNNV